MSLVPSQPQTPWGAEVVLTAEPPRSSSGQALEAACSSFPWWTQTATLPELLPLGEISAAEETEPGEKQPSFTTEDLTDLGQSQTDLWPVSKEES